MVEHQSGALIVGVVERHSALRLNPVIHVRDGSHADSLWIGCVLSGRSDPLVRCSVADPHSVAAMQMNCCAVLGVVHVRSGRNSHTQRTHSGTHNGFIHRYEEVAVDARG